MGDGGICVLSNRAPIVNPILFELDKKKKLALAHEFGAGSPCLKCNDCPGLDLHYWRKLCKECKCKKEDHDLPPDNEDPGKLRVGRLFDRPAQTIAEEESFTVSTDVAVFAGAEKRTEPQRFEWIPPNSTANLVRKYMANLPAESRPIAATEGALRRRQALERQLPLHDHDAEACHQLSAEDAQIMQKFLEFLKANVVGQGMIKERTADVDSVSTKPMENGDKITANGDDNRSHPFDAQVSKSKWICDKCKQPMFVGDVAVFAERAGPKLCWHPSCFVCCECGELLADLIYFFKDSKIYCGRHFSGLMFPRCAGCDELIFSKEYTLAEDRSWHLSHFSCFSCDKQLGGHSYMHKNDQDYCLDCYERLFARTCQVCKQKISADVNRITHNDLNWHATSDCFFCHTCKQPLLQKRFIMKCGLTFCTVECKQSLTNAKRIE